MELRVVVRNVPRMFRKPLVTLVVQKKVDRPQFFGGYVSHSLVWVDCKDVDLQEVALKLFSNKGEK